MNEASAAPSRVCAACGGRYPSDALFCPLDGTPLQSAAAAERDASDPYLKQEISGHIEIRQIVGVGAMGRVYRAFQRGIDRDVAVKILHRELSANAQLVARFTREAKVASRLQHPNVVQVLLAGQLPDRALYMVMEYLDGLSLQSALAAAGGALPLSRALHIALQLAEAVGEAHAQGIVHRDLKPENVMLVRRGHDPDFVKVLDFGIARINWGEQSVATAAGLIFGTARYISPEGAQGNAVGPESDVYAIATLLFQMLSGRTPFDGDQAVGLLVQQIHDPAPDLRSIARAAYVPEPIADVIMANLAKDPKKREPDARAFGNALFDAARLAGLSPDEFSRQRRRPSSAMAALKLPPVERTHQHDLTPDIIARMEGPPSRAPTSGSFAPTRESAVHEAPHGHGNGASPTKASAAHDPDLGKRPPTAATVKWEPPGEFQSRLAELSPAAVSVFDDSELPPGYGAPEPSPLVRARTPSGVESTIDDMALEPHAPHATERSPSFPAVPAARDPGGVRMREHTPSGPQLPSVAPHRAVAATGTSASRVPATIPGDVDEAIAIRTHFSTPTPEALAVGPRRAQSSHPSHPSYPSHASHSADVDDAADEDLRAAVRRRSPRRGLLVVVMCFLLGVGIAGAWAWRTGRFGSTTAEADEDRYVARSTAAMFQKHFAEPPYDNVKDITDEGLRRWPSSPRLLDVRARAASELTNQAVGQRSGGDVLEALRLAKLAHELNPSDAAAKRLVEQYEAELASFSPSAAPTLAKPLAPPIPSTPRSNSVIPGPAPGPHAVDYKALVDVGPPAPKLGQPVDLTARVAPAKGAFDQPAFTVSGPGVAGGVRMAALGAGPGVFKASYAFLDPGKFEVTFTTQVDGKAISAKRVVNAGGGVVPPTPTPAPTPAPTPTPTPTPAPTPSASVKWM